MDILKWVYETRDQLREVGNHRLADLICGFPEAVLAANHTYVDAVAPEAVALAQAARSPWLELFFRHWHLQSLVLGRLEGRAHLQEAVQLLEMASRDEARDCPQSVCVVQDLAACYGVIDGPGYVDERLAVAEESLARIDATWPCFICISMELAGALLDADRYEDAVAFIEQQRRQLPPDGDTRPEEAMSGELALALLELGRYDEALEVAKVKAEGRGEYVAISQNLIRTMILTGLGQTEEALQILPAAADLRKQDLPNVLWARAVERLVEAGAVRNTWDLGRDLWLMQQAFVAKGAGDHAALTALIGAELAVGRGRRAAAEIWLAEAQSCVQRLRSPEPRRRRLQQVADRLARLPVAEHEAVIPGQETNWLEGLSDDPEQALDQAEWAIRLCPGSELLTGVRAEILGALAFFNRAEQTLRSFLETEPGAAQVLEKLGSILLAAGRHDALRELIEQHQQVMPEQALWLLACSLQATGELEPCAETLRELLHHTDRPAPRSKLARVEMERGRYNEALILFESLIDPEELGDWDWNLMTVATVLGRWDLVRTTARRLELELPPGDGPVEDNFGYCWIRYQEEHRERTAFAQRTGPVTARIIEMAGPRRREHLFDHYAFDAEPLNRPQQGEEPDTYPVFRAVYRLDSRDLKTYTIDGAHPGEAWIAGLTRQLEERGGAVEVRLDHEEGYEVLVDGQPTTGLYAFVAVPTGMAPAELHSLLTAATRELDQPLAWIELAEATGDRELLQRHRWLLEQYGL